MRAVVLSGLIGAIVFSAALPPSTAQALTAGQRPLVTRAQYERWQTDLSNWGRWGKDDEMGTLNLARLRLEPTGTQAPPR